MDTLIAMRTLVSVARNGTLSAAARDLSVSIPMIGKRISGLEAHLGVKLLNRTTRHCTLTEEGERYVRDCQRILDDVAEAEASISSSAMRAAGNVRLTATSSFGRRVLAPILASFRVSRPNVHVRLHLSDSIQDLAGGRYDLALRFGPLGDSSLVATKLAKSFRVVVGSPAYLARAGIPTHPQDLLDHECIVIQGSSDALLEWTFVNSSTVIHVPVAGALSTDNGDLQQEMALLGLGLALKSIWDVADDVRAGRLVIVLPTYRCPDADLYAVYPSRHFQPRRLIDLIQHLKDSLQPQAAAIGALFRDS